jgi:hypothetical protein
VRREGSIGMNVESHGSAYKKFSTRGWKQAARGCML